MTARRLRTGYGVRGQLTACWRGGDRDGYPGWYLRFGYDHDLVEALKAKVPGSMRRWDPASKTWWVAQDFEGVLDELFVNFRTFRDQRVLPGFGGEGG